MFQIKSNGTYNDKMVRNKCLYSSINLICDMNIVVEKYIFPHLKPEFALAIPASNDEKSPHWK